MRRAKPFHCLPGLLFISTLSCAYAADPATSLGWHNDPDSFCHGYYLEPRYLPSENNNVALLTSNYVQAPLQGTWHLQDAHLLDGTQSVSAKRAELTQDPKTHKRQHIILHEDIYLRRPGTLLTGTQGSFDINKQSGTIHDSLYRLSLKQAKLTAVSPEQTRIDGPSAWGNAEQFWQLDADHFKGKQVTYSTCAPNNRIWHVRASSLAIDREEGVATATHARLYIKNLPVFYSPYLRFPIDARRKSGLLDPTVGYSRRNGWDYSQPLYLNLAPNYDDLITMRLMAKRGVQFNNQFRYLTKRHHGNINMSLLPRDAAFNDFKRRSSAKFPNHQFLPELQRADSQRRSFSWQDTTYFTPYVHSELNYNWVSDDYFINDLSPRANLATSLSNENPLLQEYKLYYDRDALHLQAAWTRYQTLEPVNFSPTRRPYNRLPHLALNWHKPWALGFNSHVDMQYTNFSLNLLQPGESRLPVAGQRFIFAPKLSLPWQTSYAFLTPSIQWHLSQYHLQRQLAGRPETITRALPIFQLDSGLYLDRDFSWQQRAYQQTLEPRLTYTYIPYQNQDAIPLFDSGILRYDYNSLFRPNRFNGIDRIGDTQQIALGITTRIQQDSGFEQARFSVGEIIFNNQQRVTICRTLGCQTTTPNPEPHTPGLHRSVIVQELAYHFNQHWSLTELYSWDPRIHKKLQQNTYLRYHAAEQKRFNLGYSFSSDAEEILSYNSASKINNTRSANASFTWPLKQHWLLLGSIEKNIEHGYLQDYLVGIEYNTCCWAFRVVSGRFFNALDENARPQFNNAVYLQWQLKGLATFATSDPSNLLRGHIANYNDNFKRY